MAKLKFIDLFAGLGGFHLALQKLGHECVFASEIREDLRKLYSINFPETRIEGDLTKFLPRDIPPHDILCAGFPCQPFSQAGKRQGFKDEKDRGNLFEYICEILDYHRPKFILLENVSNLRGHDNGNTWETIQNKLKELDYEIKDEILSPHQFKIPQHRRRIYIVGIDRTKGNLNNFLFPNPINRDCDINKIIDESCTQIQKLRADTRVQLSAWQEFINLSMKYYGKIPSFPIWAMEFGADYEYKSIAPAFQPVSELNGRKGKFGLKIKGETISECLLTLPNYAITSISKTFPLWKIRYIQQNRDFYLNNKFWIDEWLPTVKTFDNSHLKMEWNCGKKAKPIILDKIIQFRASGIRIKLPTFSPALNLVGTQIPIFPWVKLPQEVLMDGEPDKGRYMTLREASLLQGMHTIKFGDDKFNLSLTRSFEALGNAVNVTIVKHIAKKLLNI